MHSVSQTRTRLNSSQPSGRLSIFVCFRTAPILGDPGAASWGGRIFTGESLQQERESPWAFTLTERFSEAFPAFWLARKFFWPISERVSKDGVHPDTPLKRLQSYETSKEMTRNHPNQSPRHFNRLDHSSQHMTGCSLSLHQGNTESRDLEQKFLFSNRHT